MSHRVSVHSKAVSDVETIADYIAERSVQGMYSWLDAYQRMQTELSESPFAHGLAPEDAVLQRGLRQILFSTRTGLTYRALFIVDGESITILRVRGPGQEILTSDDLPAF